MTADSVPVLTIDGPSGSGKGTISRLVAEQLGWHLLDSGALYRAVGYAAGAAGLDLSDAAAVTRCAETTKIRFRDPGDGGETRVIVNSHDATDEMRTETAAAAASAPAPVAGLDTRVQEVKADVVRLNRDLLVLEEELLFPASTQVALFVSMDVGKLFELDSVQIKLDDKVVTSYLYTPAEVAALHRGGVQRVHMGNLKSGEHEIVAFFTGKGPHDRDYKRGATVKFDKGTDPKYIELRIKDSQAKLQPEFDVKVWQ